MSDEYTDYTKMYGDEGEVAPPEPETIEDLVDLEPAEAETYNYEPDPEVIPEPEPEVVPEPEDGRLLKIDLDQGSRLNVRSAPTITGSEILAQLQKDDLVSVVKDVNEDWLFVECEVDGTAVRGYVKKMYTAEV